MLSFLGLPRPLPNDSLHPWYGQKYNGAGCAMVSGCFALVWRSRSLLNWNAYPHMSTLHLKGRECFLRCLLVVVLVNPVCYYDNARVRWHTSGGMAWQMSGCILRIGGKRRQPRCWRQKPLGRTPMSVVVVVVVKSGRRAQAPPQIVQLLAGAPPEAHHPVQQADFRLTQAPSCTLEAALHD